MLPPKKVAVIHPWMPQYRTEFFSQLALILRNKNIELHVFYGETPPEWAARNDTDTNSIGTKLETRFFTVGGRNLALKNINPVIERGPYDALILEQAIRNLETYRLLLRGTKLARRRAFWGHGRTYTEDRSPLEERIKLELTKRSDWFFGYTDAGVRHLVANGYTEARTTVVRNSMDSKYFAEMLRQIQFREIDEFVAQHDLRGRTALYIGGLDAAKRLDFLLAAADLAYSRDPLFRLLVVGAGSQSEWLAEQAKSRQWIKMLGASTGSVKYLAFRSAQVLAIPGRVGLVAVDSLAAGVPIVTTKWPFHAPEFEYLEPGRTCQVTDNTIEDYGRTLLATICDADLLDSMSRACLTQAPNHTIEKMASNFADGVSALLDAD